MQLDATPAMPKAQTIQMTLQTNKETRVKAKESTARQRDTSVCILLSFELPNEHVQARKGAYIKPDKYISICYPVTLDPVPSLVLHVRLDVNLTVTVPASFHLLYFDLDGPRGRFEKVDTVGGRAGRGGSVCCIAYSNTINYYRLYFHSTTVLQY